MRHHGYLKAIKLQIKINAENIFKNQTTNSWTTNFNNEEFLEMIRKIVKEEIENYKEKVGEIVKAQLEYTNNWLDWILQKVVGITKGLEFMQEQLDE